MGAWGFGNFENDSALDWVDNFLNYSNLDFVRNTLLKIVDSNSYIQVDEASAAIAAAEIIAAINGNPSTDFPSELFPFVQKNKELGSINDLAIKTVNKVFDKSELASLWGTEFSLKMKNDLIQRLK